MQKILEGLNRFQKEVFPQQRELFESLRRGQEPEALFITCGDSRLVPTLFTQTKPGQLFISRQVGNIVPPHGTVYGGVSATVEYAVGALAVKHIIVCGHSDCGAMRAVLHPERLDKLPNVKKWLDNVESARQVVDASHPNASDKEKLDALIRENVLVQVRHLETHPVVAVAKAKGELAIHGWVYEIETGEVDAYDFEREQFVRITFPQEPANPHERNDAVPGLHEEVATHG